MRTRTKLALLSGLWMSTSPSFANLYETTDSESYLTHPTTISSDAALDENDPAPDEPWDGRRYWYCNARPARWAGNWNRRDYEAFGRQYWRVHHNAESRCERFHRMCAVWCERRHAWEWDGGMPVPERG